MHDVLRLAVLQVVKSGADLGIVFDTDVDRSAVVAANGEPINSNRYIGLMSYIALRCNLDHLVLDGVRFDNCILPRAT